MLRLAQEGKPIRLVNDQWLTPTYTVDLARKMEELITTNHYGLYHITSGGDCTGCEFAVQIFKLAGLSPELLPTTMRSFGAKAMRPHYSVLNSRPLGNVGVQGLRTR